MVVYQHRVEGLGRGVLANGWRIGRPKQWRRRMGARAGVWAMPRRGRRPGPRDRFEAGHPWVQAIEIER